MSCESAFAFKGQTINIPDIAEQLNVTYVLEGSVRKAGNTVRVTAQLIRGQSDTHIWSETYDRTLEDIFAIQDDIADKAFELLEDGYAEDPDAFGGAFSDALFRNLRDDPRWHALMEKAGTTPEQIAAVEFDISVPD